eukprot:829688-Karenia_brevis.AAC.1
MHIEARALESPKSAITVAARQSAAASSSQAPVTPPRTTLSPEDSLAYFHKDDPARQNIAQK